VALILNNLTKGYEDQSRFAEVEEAGQRVSCDSREGARPEPSGRRREHEQPSPLARTEEAGALYKRALGIRKRRSVPITPKSLPSSTTLRRSTKLRAAPATWKTYSKRALAIVTKALGPDNSDTAKVIRELGVAYDAQGR
jgi:hypothetical protein